MQVFVVVYVNTTVLGSRGGWVGGWGYYGIGGWWGGKEVGMVFFGN
jgi:hypothetical protein